MNKTRIVLISGVAVATAGVAFAAVGIDHHGAPLAPDPSQGPPSATASASRASANALASDASDAQLPTTPVPVPAGSQEYAASWRLDSSSGKTLSISIAGPGSGCTTLGYVQVSETPTTVTMTPEVVFDQPRGEGCTANLAVETGTVTLAAPLGNRALVHGTTTLPRTAG